MTRGRLLQFDLPQAFLLAIVIHLLLFVGGEVRPDLLPWPTGLPEPPPDPGPLRFEFVDIPDRAEPEVAPEDAPFSDRTRVASSPEPPKPVPESADPYSEGNTFQKMDQPLAPEIQPSDASVQVPPEQPREPEQAEPDSQVPAEGEPVQDAGDGATDDARDKPLDDAREGPAPAGPGAGEEVEPADARKAQAILDAARPFSLRELGQRYDNLAAPSNIDFGPVSFDTKGIDWGPYAKRIIEIIRRNWIERLPPAYDAKLKGVSVVSCRIRKDGTITDITLVDGSGVRPYDKAAEFSLAASSPLPPLPEAFSALGKEDEKVTFAFYYWIRPPSP